MGSNQVIVTAIPIGNFPDDDRGDIDAIRLDREEDSLGDSTRESGNNDSDRSSTESPTKVSKTDAADIGIAGTKYTNNGRQIKPKNGIRSESTFSGDTLVTIWYLNGKKDLASKGKVSLGDFSSFFGKTNGFIGDVTGISSIYESASNIWKNGGSFGDYVTVGLAIGGGALAAKLYKWYRTRGIRGGIEGELMET